MNIKVVFIGNPLGGDDGIGPRLFTELKDNPKLKPFELLELGVIGLDLLSYVEDDDKLIIVDAVRSETGAGEVILLEEKDLTTELNMVSQHDFGVAETVKVLRIYKPNIESIRIIGIKVKNLNAFVDKLSPELVKELPRIKEEVISLILKIGGTSVKSPVKLEKIKNKVKKKEKKKDKTHNLNYTKIESN